MVELREQHGARVTEEWSDETKQCWLCKQVETSTFYQVSFSLAGRIKVLAEWLIKNPEGDAAETRLAIADLAKMSMWIPKIDVSELDPGALRAALKKLLATGQQLEEGTKDTATSVETTKSSPLADFRIEGQSFDQYALMALLHATGTIKSGFPDLDQEIVITRWEHATDYVESRGGWERHLRAYRLFTEVAGKERAILLVAISVEREVPKDWWWVSIDWKRRSNTMPRSAFRLLWNAGWIDLPASKLIQLLGRRTALALGIKKGEKRPRTPRVPITTSTIQGGLDRETRQALAQATKAIKGGYCGPPGTCEITGWDRIAEEGQIWAFRFYFTGRKGPVPYLIVIKGKEGTYWVRPFDHYTEFDTPIPQALWDLIERAGWVKLTVRQLRQMVSEGFATHLGTLVTGRNGSDRSFNQYLLAIYALPNGGLVTVDRQRMSQYKTWDDPNNAPTDRDTLQERDEGWNLLTYLESYPDGDNVGIALEDRAVRRSHGGGTLWIEKLHYRISSEGEGIPLNDPTALAQALPDGWFTPA